jgi:hypothetical protein
MAKHTVQSQQVSCLVRAAAAPHAVVPDSLMLAVYQGSYLEHLLRLSTLSIGGHASNGCTETGDDDRAWDTDKRQGREVSTATLNRLHDRMHGC